jgi:hypothetical protein
LALRGPSAYHPPRRRLPEFLKVKAKWTHKKPTKEKQMPPKKLERPVVVTTEHGGVFFGYADDTDGDPIHLERARMCLYWTADLRGFMGLATIGPTAGCRIGTAAPSMDVRKITSVLEVTPKAAAAWEAAPWKP